MKLLKFNPNTVNTIGPANVIAENSRVTVHAGGEVTKPVLIWVRQHRRETGREVDKAARQQRHVSRELKRVETTATGQIEHEPGR